MSSISSCLLSKITSFRNPNGPEQEWRWTENRAKVGANPLKVVLAEVGYIAVIPFAIIETALSAIAKLFSACLPIGPARHEAMTNWLKSSAFSVAWSLGDTTINLFCNDMIVTEKVARACASNRNIFNVPREAL